GGELFPNLRCDDIDLDEVAFCERNDDAFYAEIRQDLKVFFSLWHPAVVHGDHEQREIDRANPRDHIAHEIFVTWNIDNPEMKFLATRAGEIEFGKSQINRDAPRFFFGKTVRICS